MSVKNRKGGFCLYDSLRIPLAAPPPNTLCPWAGGEARAFCAVPPARAASQVRLGVRGLVPAKPFRLNNFSHRQAKQRTLRAKPQKAGKRGGGIGDKREGGVHSAARRECGANLRASSSQCSKQQPFTDCLAFDETPSKTPEPV